MTALRTILISRVQMHQPQSHDRLNDDCVGLRVEDNPVVFAGLRVQLNDSGYPKSRNPRIAILILAENIKTREKHGALQCP